MAKCTNPNDPDRHCYHLKVNPPTCKGVDTQVCCFCGALERDEHGPYHPGNPMPYQTLQNTWTPFPTQYPTITCGGQHGPNLAGGLTPDSRRAWTGGIPDAYQANRMESMR